MSMKKHQLKFLAFALVFALGIGYAYAAWNNPGFTPPTGGSEIPVNSGDRNSQIKNGGLSVEKFVAESAQFDQQVFVPQMIRGGNVGDPVSTVKFGFYGGTNISYVSINANGGINTHDTLQAGRLTNPGGAQVCADDMGKLILCK